MTLSLITYAQLIMQIQDKNMNFLTNVDSFSSPVLDTFLFQHLIQKHLLKVLKTTILENPRMPRSIANMPNMHISKRRWRRISEKNKCERK